MSFLNRLSWQSTWTNLTSPSIGCRSDRDSGRSQGPRSHNNSFDHTHDIGSSRPKCFLKSIRHKNTLFLLEQKNLLLAGLATKLVLSSNLFSNPEFFFSIHPQILYCLIENNFIFSHNPIPRVEILLENSLQLRQFLIETFELSLFEPSMSYWKANLDHYQSLDLNSIKTAASLIKRVDFVLNDD